MTFHLLFNTNTMKTTISLILALMYFLPIQTEAKVPYNSDYCDAMYNELWFKEVPPTIQKECKNRFTFLTNSIKRQLPQYVN